MLVNNLNSYSSDKYNLWSRTNICTINFCELNTVITVWF